MLDFLRISKSTIGMKCRKGSSGHQLHLKQQQQKQKPPAVAALHLLQGIRRQWAPMQVVKQHPVSPYTTLMICIVVNALPQTGVPERHA